MRAVLQRVTSASVSVEGEVVGAIEQGLCVLVGVGAADTATDAEVLAKKVLELRIFEDESGRMNQSVTDVAGGVLAVPQFTLYADVSRGRRPSFAAAMAPDDARALFEHFAQALRAGGVPVATGRFRTHMAVALVNDGPVTITIDTAVRA